jgi:excisionase family DNA binding protein
MNADCEVLDTNQAARLLGVSKRTLFKLVRTGAIPAGELTPRLYRFSRAALIRCLDEAKDERITHC